jgi:hypothetical protein
VERGGTDQKERIAENQIEPNITLFSQALPIPLTESDNNTDRVRRGMPDSMIIMKDIHSRLPRDLHDYVFSRVFARLLMEFMYYSFKLSRRRLVAENGSFL